MYTCTNCRNLHDVSVGGSVNNVFRFHPWFEFSNRQTAHFKYLFVFVVRGMEMYDCVRCFCGVANLYDYLIVQNGQVNLL